MTGDRLASNLSWVKGPLRCGHGVELHHEAIPDGPLAFMEGYQSGSSVLMLSSDTIRQMAQEHSATWQVVLAEVLEAIEKFQSSQPEELCGNITKHVRLWANC
jgi:hypothetical protein